MTAILFANGLRADSKLYIRTDLEVAMVACHVTGTPSSRVKIVVAGVVA